MSGEWAVSGHFDYFSFWSDTSGVWATKGKVTGAPLFVLRQKDNRLYIIPITELGDYTDPIEIKSVDEQKMVFYYPESKNKLNFKRVKDQYGSDGKTFVAKRLGYFNATLTIYKDSVYKYSESNHKGQKLNDTGKLLYKNGEYYLNSSEKTIRTSNNNKTKSDSFYKFSMQKFNYSSNKIILIPCDSIFPEYSTFIRTPK